MGLWSQTLKKNIPMITSAKLNGRTTIELVTVKAPNISEYVDFDFYDFVS